MKIFFAITITALLISACGEKGNDNDAIVVKSEIPTGNFNLPESSTTLPEEPEPASVNWTQLQYVNENFYVMVDANSDGQSDLPSGCDYEVRFAISPMGQFAIEDKCTGYGRSGMLSASDLARINSRASRINIEEVNSNLLCELYNAPVGYPGKSARIILQNTEGQTFTLWKGFGAQVCFPSNRGEIASLHKTLWETLKNYVTLDFAK